MVKKIRTFASMKRIYVYITVLVWCLIAATQFGKSRSPIVLESSLAKRKVDSIVLFNKAVMLIKHYEQWHSPKHYPYIGYGHRILKTDNVKLPISRATGERLLIKDLKKNMRYFNGSYKERLLMGMLSYNIGQNKVLKSTVYSLIKSGDYSIPELRENYVCWCQYNGKHHKMIHQRRIDEFELIYK